MKGFKVNMERLGEYCKIMRLRSGYKLRELEKRFNISKSNLSKFEHGGNNSASILMLYLNFLPMKRMYIKLYIKELLFMKYSKKEMNNNESIYKKKT